MFVGKKILLEKNFCWNQIFVGKNFSLKFFCWKSLPINMLGLGERGGGGAN